MKIFIKDIFFAAIVIIQLASNDIYAQESAGNSTDTVVVINVDGACEMCKERIETVAKDKKGVRDAVWDIHSKKLKLVYNPLLVTVEKIQKSIADAGHDNDYEKAKDKVYEKLPACCRYREINHPKEKPGENYLNNNAGNPVATQVVKGLSLIHISEPTRPY